MATPQPAYRKRSEEERLRNQERLSILQSLRAARWKFVFEVATVVGIWFAALVAIAAIRDSSGDAEKQRRAMQEQLDAMVAAQRPWLNVVPEIVRPLIFVEAFGQKTVHVTVNHKLTVVGPTPARNITIFLSIVPHPGNAHADQLDVPLTNLCAEAERLSEVNRIAGPTVFPGETKYAERATGSAHVYMDDDIPILFSVQGCVDYAYADSRHGKSAFRMLLGQKGTQFWEGLKFKRPSEPVEGKPVMGTATLERTQFDFEEDPSGGNYVQ